MTPFPMRSDVCFVKTVGARHSLVTSTEIPGNLALSWLFLRAAVSAQPSPNLARGEASGTVRVTAIGFRLKCPKWAQGWGDRRGRAGVEEVVWRESLRALRDGRYVLCDSFSPGPTAISVD